MGLSDKQFASACWAGAVVLSVMSLAIITTHVTRVWAVVQVQRPVPGAWYWTTEEMLEKHQGDPQKWVAIRFTGD